MLEEKWEQIVEMVKKNFKSASLTSEDLLVTTMDGQQKQGTQDILTFESPNGRFKLVRENRPLILEKKEHYSHRQGDTARTQYKLSDTEFTHKLRVFKDQGFDDWEEVTLESLGL